MSYVRFGDSKYLIIQASDASKVDYSIVLNENAETLLTSVDGRWSIIKWRGDTPSFVSSLSNTSAILDHEQIITELGVEESHWAIHSRHDNS